MTVASGSVEQRTKVVLCETQDPMRFRDLRTVDDVAIVSAISPDIEDMAGLQALIADGDGLDEAIEMAKRSDRMDGSFSVTVSAARTALGSSGDIEQGVASVISKRYGWQHQELKRSAIDVRVFMDGSWGLVGVRLFDEPLSKRDYRVVNVRGSLRPTVGAALVRLGTGGKKAQRVWDPFCGSGTILCEAALAGHDVWGTDIDTDAVAASRTNIATVNRDFWSRIENADSTSPKTWQKHRNANVVVSNLPWGKQVAIKSKQTLYDVVSSGVATTARAGGAGVLLTTEPARIMQRLRNADVSVDERRIGLLGQTPTILIVRPS